VGSVRVRLFATAREAVGRAELDRAVPRSGSSLSELLRAMASDYPGIARVLPACRFAKNGRYVRGRSTRLVPGDELAIHPPYSGG
jgi:molybdopterin converting factor small subunit